MERSGRVEWWVENKNVLVQVMHYRNKEIKEGRLEGEVREDTYTRPELDDQRKIEPKRGLAWKKKKFTRRSLEEDLSRKKEGTGWAWNTVRISPDKRGWGRAFAEKKVGGAGRGGLEIETYEESPYHLEKYFRRNSGEGV